MKNGRKDVRRDRKRWESCDGERPQVDSEKRN